MTRDEAMNTVMQIRSVAPEPGGAGVMVDCLVALGLLKLDEPKSDWGPAVDALRATDVALVGYVDDRGNSIQYAGRMNDKSIHAVLNALGRANLQIVEKDKA